MLNKAISNKVFVFIWFFLTIVTFLSFSFFLLNIDFFSNLQLLINVFGFFGLLFYVFSIYIFYIRKKTIFNIFTIFLTFLFIFHFGQCCFWTFGFHLPNEIGSFHKLYGSNMLDLKTIITSEFIVIVSYCFIVLGLLLSDKSKLNNLNNNNNDIVKKATQNKALYVTSFILSLFVIPITYYFLVRKILFASQYGYKSIYYGEYNQGFISIFSNLFFPCMFGLLFGSDFDKKVVRLVYFFVAIFILLSLAIGDRGEWLYPLAIFLIIHNNYYKKINGKNFFKIFLIFLLFLPIIDTIVEFRNYGISIDKIFNNYSIKENLIIKNIFYMGSTMGIVGILVKNGYHIYPYGNSYLFGIIGIVSDKIIHFLGFDYINLSGWFSQSYLGLGQYGAGFSMIGESIMNFGPFFGPVFLLFLSFVFGKIFSYNEDDTCFKKVFSIISLSIFINMTRGTFAYNMKLWFLENFIYFFAVYFIYSKFYRERSNKDA